MIEIANWNFLTNYGRALLCIERDPQVRLREIATNLGITERHAYGIVDELARSGYIIKEKVGRCNHYQVQEQLPLPEAREREQTIGQVLNLLKGREEVRSKVNRPIRW
jgi:MarR-like DNA-binding transcriptional regulator SgrR of sgrS sRNA